MAALHDTGRSHPERPERLGAVLRGLSESGLELIEVEAAMIERADLALVHDPAYVDAIERFCRLAAGLDMDTYVSSDTWAAAMTAVGGVKAVAEELEGRDDATGFALCRPRAITLSALGRWVFACSTTLPSWRRGSGHGINGWRSWTGTSTTGTGRRP